MLEKFEVRCNTCGEKAAVFFGTATMYGAIVLVKVKCLINGCGKVEELPITQVSMIEYDSMKGD